MRARTGPEGALYLAMVLALAACAQSAPEENDATDTAETSGELAVIPEALAPFGNGYPTPGSACVLLGESEATSNYLDDSALLVGCPDQASADALSAPVVASIDGVRLVSVPMGDANAAMGGIPMVEEMPDLADPITGYNATTQIPCGFAGAAPQSSCPAGVKRRWGEDGTNLVEVTKPDGLKRALYFNGTEPYGADSAQADGSAGWDFAHTRDGDMVTITYGPETYVIADALIVGG